MTLHATCDRCGGPGIEARRKQGDGHGYSYVGPDCEVQIKLMRECSVPPMPYGDLCFSCLKKLVEETMAGTKKDGPRAKKRGSR